MSLDYDDPSLDRLLTEHARRSRAEFSPPGLDGMLSSALDSSRPHRRWMWPALAAVLLLAIPLVTVLLARHGRTDGQPARPASNAKLVQIGPVSWRDPVWTGKSIWFVAQLSWSQYCEGVPSVHADLTEDGAASVTIVASVSSNPDPAAMTEFQKEECSHLSSDSSGGIGSSSNAGPPGPPGPPDGVGIDSYVDLPEPLDGRSAFDGTAHVGHKVLDASIIPSIPGLPPTFHDADYDGNTDQKWVSRSWQVADFRDAITLSLTPVDSSLGSRYLHQGQPSTIGLVNGHQTRLDPVSHLVIWKNGAYVYLIQEVSTGGDYYRFSSAAQLLDLARSVP